MSANCPALSESNKTFFFPTLLTASSISSHGGATTTTKTASITPLVFMPNIEKKGKINKVPVYRQNAKNHSCAEVKPENSIKNGTAIF